MGRARAGAARSRLAPRPRLRHAVLRRRLLVSRPGERPLALARARRTRSDRQLLAAARAPALVLGPLRVRRPRLAGGVPRGQPRPLPRRDRAAVEPGAGPARPARGAGPRGAPRGAARAPRRP